MPWAWAARNWRQVGPSRRGAGSIPVHLRISHTVLGASRQPSLASSPWITSVSPGGVSEAKRRTNRRSSGDVRRPAVQRRGWVQRCVTKSRCHRKIVAGVTIRGSSQARDNSRVSAANTARSTHDSCDRLTWRRNTATSCRRTRISAFFDRELRASSPSQATRCRKTRYSNRSATAGDHARQHCPPTQQVSVMDDQFGTPQCKRAVPHRSRHVMFRIRLRLLRYPRELPHVLIGTPIRCKARIV
jgi:hypothetical protein